MPVGTRLAPLEKRREVVARVVAYEGDEEFTSADLAEAVRAALIEVHPVRGGHPVEPYVFVSSRVATAAQGDT